MGVILYHYILCVALLMALFVLCVACLTVFVNCMVKEFVMCLCVVVILECVCDPSVHLDAPSIGCVCRKLSPHLRV